MVSVYTPNINLEEPARGDQVGIWDVPVNGNMTLTDLVVGGIATISLNNSPVVLAAAQFQARQITFNSTLTGSCAITFPSTFTKSYDIQNLCTGSSAFVITLGTTVAGGQVIAIPFGETTECFNDGTNVKFRNLGRIGTYWDYAGSSVPAWVTGCTVPPYLNCDATTFSATTYPTLAVILGSTTLPDGRGNVRGTLNQGTARMTTANGGLDGNTIFAKSSADTQTLIANQIPTINSVGTITVTVAGGNTVPSVSQAGANYTNGSLAGGVNTFPINTGGSPWAYNLTFIGTGQTMASNNTGGAAHTIMQPTFIGGITMIRAG